MRQRGAERRVEEDDPRRERSGRPPKDDDRPAHSRPGKVLAVSIAGTATAGEGGSDA